MIYLPLQVKKRFYVTTVPISDSDINNALEEIFNRTDFDFDVADIKYEGDFAHIHYYTTYRTDENTNPEIKGDGNIVINL